MMSCRWNLMLAGGLLLIVACVPGPAAAQQPIQPSGWSAADTSQAKADYASMAWGASITSGGQTYTVLPDVRAVPSETGQAPAGLTALERKGQFVIYRETRAEMKTSSAMSVQDASATGATGQPLLTHAVVLNPRTGRVGVVLGTLAVKLADVNQAAAIAAAKGLTVSAVFAHLNLAVFAAAPGQDLAAAADALRADARVTSADPEILENPRVPY